VKAASKDISSSSDDSEQVDIKALLANKNQKQTPAP
jgi:hypothetical protein